MHVEARGVILGHVACVRGRFSYMGTWGTGPVILPCCLILVAIVAILHVTCHVDPLGSMKRTSQDLTHYDFLESLPAYP